MKRLVIFAALLTAACGVDGEPVQPAGGVNVSLTSSSDELDANRGIKSGSSEADLSL